MDWNTGLCVAPREGAWIEIIAPSALISTPLVAPREGAWIEIYGDKFMQRKGSVAPREGAWIEISTAGAGGAETGCRAP